MSTTSISGGIDMRVGNEARDASPFVTQFRWVESLIRGGFFWEMQFKANVWREWTDVLLGRDRPRIQFRIKNQEEGEEASTEWRTAITDRSSMAFKGEALLGQVLGSDRRLEMRQAHKIRAWPARTVTEIVQVLAGEYDLEARADDTGVREDWYQIHETDWAFLQRIVYESASAGGRGDLFLWVDEDILNLRAPVFQATSDRRHDMSVVENRVDHLVLDYMGREVDRQGGATLQGVGYDFLQKRAVTYTLDSAQAQTHPALADRVPRSQAAGLRIYPVAETDQASVESITRGRWGKFAPRYFPLRVTTRADITLRPGTMLEMQATLGENQETPFLGRFLIAEVEHVYQRGAIITSAICYRREASEGDDAATGSNAESVRSRDNYHFGTRNEPRTIVTAEVLG